MNVISKHLTKVADETSGVRLDVFVKDSLSGVSRSRAKALIDDGCVLVNGVRPKAAKILSAGDLVEVNIPPLSEPSARPENIPLDVVYEDCDIIVVNKPAGMVVHPAAGHPNGTLVNALLYHCKDLSGIGGELKPGIVHRLDLGTSGAIIAAKNDETHRNLTQQFKARTAQKIYLALVFGSMRADSGRFDSSIGRSLGDRKKMSARTKKGRTALTEWKVLKRFGTALSWLEIHLRTGRMHQIRVHFSESGHPLVGDPVYGGRHRVASTLGESVASQIKNFPRPVLHAFRLEITHPKTGERMKFEAPIPDDIKSLLSKIWRHV